MRYILGDVMKLIIPMLVITNIALAFITCNTNNLTLKADCVTMQFIVFIFISVVTCVNYKRKDK